MCNKAHAGTIGERWRVYETLLGKELKKFTQGKLDKKNLTYEYTTTDEKGNTTNETGRTQHYLLPSLDECRALFEAYRGTTFDWPQEIEMVDLKEENEAEF